MNLITLPLRTIQGRALEKHGEAIINGVLVVRHPVEHPPEDKIVSGRVSFCLRDVPGADKLQRKAG